LLEESTVLTHCQENLGKYKVPKKVIFIDSLPKNSTGKIQKNKLKNLISR